MSEFLIAEDFHKNQTELVRSFCGESACNEYFPQLIWPEDFACSKCGHTEYWESGRRL
jgi:hypothetical protein